MTHRIKAVHKRQCLPWLARLFSKSRVNPGSPPEPLIYDKVWKNAFSTAKNKHYGEMLYLLIVLICDSRNRFYSETGCSFVRHFAILSCNVGILISSLLRASCDSNFNCCLSKRFFILEYCELTAMASNITSVSKREKVICSGSKLKFE